jgi:hypothetical protein
MRNGKLVKSRINQNLLATNASLQIVLPAYRFYRVVARRGTVMMNVIRPRANGGSVRRWITEVSVSTAIPIKKKAAPTRTYCHLIKALSLSTARVSRSSQPLVGPPPTPEGGWPPEEVPFILSRYLRFIAFFATAMGKAQHRPQA